MGGCFVATNATAQLYIHPRAGATIPTSGDDISYTLGLSVGYQWTRFFATEGTYMRWIATGSGADGDEVTGQGILGYPTEYFTPYINGGVGFLHTEIAGNNEFDPVYLVGAGISLHPFRFFSIGVGVTYEIVDGRTDFIQPSVGIGLTF